MELARAAEDTSETYRQAREVLESRDFIVFTIESKTLAQLLDEQPEYFAHVNPSKALRDFKPNAVEIAIQIKQPTLSDGNNKTQKEQIKMIREWGLTIQKEAGLKDLEIRMGYASEYAQIDIAYQKKYRQKLFPNFYTRALDEMGGSYVACVGRIFPERRLDVYDWRADKGQSNVWAVPVVVLPLRK